MAANLTPTGVWLLWVSGPACRRLRLDGLQRRSLGRPLRRRAADPGVLTLSSLARTNRRSSDRSSAQSSAHGAPTVKSPTGAHGGSAYKLGCPRAPLGLPQGPNGGHEPSSRPVGTSPAGSTSRCAAPSARPHRGLRPMPAPRRRRSRRPSRAFRCRRSISSAP